MENRGGGDCTPRGNVCLGMGRFAPAAGGYRNFNSDLGFVISNDGLHWREPVWKPEPMRPVARTDL